MANDNNYMIFLKPGISLSSGLTKRAATVKDYHGELMTLLTASQFLTTIQQIALYAESLANYDTSELLALVYQHQQAPDQFDNGQLAQLQRLLADFRARIEETDKYVN